jgi:hypothetical protein
MKDFVWKHLDIANIADIQTQLKEYVFNNLTESESAFTNLDVDKLLENCKLIKEYFDSNKLTIRRVALVVHGPGAGIGGAHVDIQPFDLAINIGIHNAVLTHTAFYKLVSGEPTYLVQANGLPFTSYRSAVLEEIDRYTLQKPVIFNTKQIHSVHNDSTDKRISITFRFTRDPWELTV